ncbi:DUF7311 family protein [Halorussus amylolyticus]|uniref:DUF7311 family protein n=1 Tax=Halorussus amylolyticus TaxID=1126242 RepID=UPI00104BA244|nr:hypothetical protein [Halorussus amylolyticus]
MLRTVLAVALAVALVAAATSALDSARTARSERLTEAELDRIEAAAESLVSEESPAEPGTPGPRRTLTVSLPGESLTTAPVALVALGGIPGGNSAADTDERDAFASRIDGGRHRVRRVGFDLRAAVPTENNRGWRLAPDDGPLVLRGGETHRVVLRLVRIDGRPTVVASARRFKSEDGTTSPHARPAGAIS